MANISAEQARRAKVLAELAKGAKTWNPEELSAADEMRASLSRTGYEDITDNPEYASIQRQTLGRLGQISEKGYTAEEEAAAARLRSQSNQDDASRRASILQNMQMRGGGGGGAELAAMLSSADAAAERQAQGSADAAANAQRRMLSALEERGRMAGQMQSEEYQKKARAAEARDRMNEFNARVAGQFAQSRNQTRNDASRYNTGTGNDWSMRTGELNYTDATNEMNRKLMEEQEKKRRKAQAQSGVGAAIGGVAGGIVGGYATGGSPMGAMAGASAGSQLGSTILSDEKKKENIKDLSGLDIDEFLLSIQPKEFDYKPGSGGAKRVGVVAQDLEGSRVGDRLVSRSAEGDKEIDVENLLGAIVASLSRLEHKKRDK